MNSRCQMLCIAETPPGSLLAESILAPDGSVEWPKGTAVTAAMLDQLRNRGVTALSVVLADEEISTAESAIKERLDHVFRHAGGNQPSLDLKRQIATYRLAKNDG